MFNETDFSLIRVDSAAQRLTYRRVTVYCMPDVFGARDNDPAVRAGHMPNSGL